MSRRPRDIGTAAETAVVRYLTGHGFPHAERRSLRGALDAGDITGTPGIAWEVKGGQAAKTAPDGLITAWLAETETERINARADVGVLVVQRAGIGPANAGQWWALLPLWGVRRLTGSSWHHSAWLQPARLHLMTACDLLRAAGYGDELEAVAG